MTERDYIINVFKRKGIIDMHGTFSFPVYQKSELDPLLVSKASYYGIIPSIITKEEPKQEECLETTEEQIDTEVDSAPSLKNTESELGQTKKAKKNSKKK